jgi:hypothetical protein
VFPHVNLQDITIVEKEEVVQKLIKPKHKFKMEYRRVHMLEA